MPLMDTPGVTSAPLIRNIVFCSLLSLPLVTVTKVPMRSRVKFSGTNLNTEELTSHQTQPVSAAAITAPQAYSSQFFTTDCRVLFAESKPINSLLVGTLAKTPSLPLKPFGGHLGCGEGIGLAVFLATTLISPDFWLAISREEALIGLHAATDEARTAIAKATGNLIEPILP